MSGYCEFGYEGTVKSFNTVLTNNWKGTTRAKSEKQARSNLIYQYKKQHDLDVRSAKISLPGRVFEIED